MRPKLEKRPEPSRLMVVVTPIASVLLTMMIGVIVFDAIGINGQKAVTDIFLTPLLASYKWQDVAVKAAPLIIIALGLSIGNRANVWNIGAEGQFTIGAICGAGVALAFGGDDRWWVLPLMLLASVAGGLAWAGIAAFLRTKFNAHEILTTLMLTYVAIQLLGWLVHGPWQDPDGFNFPQTRQFAADATLPLLIEGTRVNIGALIALAAVPLGSLLLGRTLAGFRIRVVGLAPGAARYAGFSEKGTVWFCLLLSGGMAGLAGICEAAGPIGQLQPVISPGYGFAAIIVAFLGRLHPVGILFASLLMALLYLGGEGLQMSQQLPLAATGVIQGMLLFFLLGTDVFVQFRLRLVPARKIPVAGAVRHG